MVQASDRRIRRRALFGDVSPEAPLDADESSGDEGGGGGGDLPADTANGAAQSDSDSESDEGDHEMQWLDLSPLLCGCSALGQLQVSSGGVWRL